MSFDPSEIKRLLERPWGLFEQANRAHWGSASALTKLRIADSMRKQASERGWPASADRAEDLAAHRRLCELVIRGSGRARLDRELTTDGAS